MNIEENPIKEEISCDCCLTNINVKICNLEKCDYPLCHDCFNKIPSICPKCRRKIKEETSEKVIDIETLEIDLDYEEIYRENTVKCCLNSYKIQNCLNYFLDTITNISIVILMSTIISIFITLLVLLGRLVTYFFQIGCYDYWCKITNEKTGEEVYCIECFIGWGILGIVIGFVMVCLSAGACCGKSEDDC